MKEYVDITSTVRPTSSLSDAPHRLVHETSNRLSVRLSAGLPAQLGLTNVEGKLDISEAAKPSALVRKASKSSKKRRMNEKRERNRVERQMAKWLKTPKSPSDEYAHLAKTVAHQDTHRARPPGGRRKKAWSSWFDFKDAQSDLVLLLFLLFGKFLIFIIFYFDDKKNYAIVIARYRLRIPSRRTGSGT